MKRIFLLILILIECAILRFYYVNSLPPLIDTSYLNARIISVILSLGIAIIIFFYVNNIFKSRKYALLSMFFFTNLPWTIEQGRIVSQVNNYLFFFILTLLLSKKFKNYILKIFFWCFLLLSSIWLYPSFWLFRVNQYNFSLQDFINSLFLLTSPEFLFFKNPTFWWGGVRETGVMLFVFIPLFIIGLYRFLLRIKFEIVAAFLVILIISALSPFLPESREYYLITPFISIVLALGTSSLFHNKNPLSKVLFYFLFILIIYDLSEFLHYYYVHYPQQIISNINLIHGPF